MFRGESCTAQALKDFSDVVPLISALRLADANDCDWVYEALPSIFGRIGEAALEPLRQVVRDASNTIYVRDRAMSGMAAITLSCPNRRNEVFDFIASILTNYSESLEFRAFAASILTDFKQNRHAKILRDFGREEELYSEREPSFMAYFGSEEEVERALTGEPNLTHYRSDWLSFYLESEIQARQKRWRQEFSWWGRLLSPLRLLLFRWQFRRRIGEIEKINSRVWPR